MYKEYFPKNKRLNKEKLLELSFKEKNDSYFKSFNINDFTLNINVYSSYLETELIDNRIDSEYTLHKNLSANGKYASEIRKLYNEIIEELFSKILDDDMILETVFSYIYNKYNIKPDNPFKDLDSYVFRRLDNNKWFGLIIEIDISKLKIKSNQKGYVLNIKIDEDKRDEIIDNIHYFECYHMNKKKWVSILLSNDIDLDKLYKYIDRSYELIGGK
ncbi:MAG: MmcQ/YjbR family DNA-binding protein [Gammaproteobacteria bacterium]|nr:MmcQ/YjbR family DNA-binding protein [Gammaproteobacteria bacterium]